MNLLIIGNGFDLAHGLPTQYKDFLKFVNLANAILEDDLDTIENIKTSDENDEEEIKKTKNFMDFINSLKNEDDFKYIENIHELSCNNLWFNYFNNLKSKFNTWIDFESEISKVIQILESVKEAKDNALLYNLKSFESHNGINVLADSLKKTISNKKNMKKKSNQNNNKTYYTRIESYSFIVNTLLKDLNRLTRCLEIYLSFYINSLYTGARIPEILALRNNIDYVLSFNYTNTFERFYGRPNIEYDYIHGKANLENTVEACQLVLGIDEYLDEEERNKNIDFIQYKKYFQRVYKKTGCKYKKWLDDLETSNNKRYSFDEKLDNLNIYILGHSLDITDKDILNTLIMFDKNNPKSPTTVNVTIFDHNKKASASHIANLVRVITQEELINGVYGEDGKNPKIVFKPQSESINIYDTED